MGVEEAPLLRKLQVDLVVVEDKVHFVANNIVTAAESISDQALALHSAVSVAAVAANCTDIVLPSPAALVAADLRSWADRVASRILHTDHIHGR